MLCFCFAFLRLFSNVRAQRPLEHSISLTLVLWHRIHQLIGKFHLIKQKYKNIIVGISSILPRPKDHSLSDTDIKNVNLGLAKICKDEKVLFIRSYKRFFYSNGIIKRDLFAIRDGGLHLNEPGLFQFKLALIHVISHW